MGRCLEETDVRRALESAADGTEEHAVAQGQFRAIEYLAGK